MCPFLSLIAREGANLLEVGDQEAIEDHGTKGTGAAGDHQGGVGKCGHFCYPSFSVFLFSF